MHRTGTDPNRTERSTTGDSYVEEELYTQKSYQ